MKIGDYETAEFALKEFIQKIKVMTWQATLNIGTVKHLELDNFTLMQLQHI